MQLAIRATEKMRLAGRRNIWDTWVICTVKACGTLGVLSECRWWCGCSCCTSASGSTIVVARSLGVCQLSTRHPDKKSKPQKEHVETMCRIKANASLKLINASAMVWSTTGVLCRVTSWYRLRCLIRQVSQEMLPFCISFRYRKLSENSTLSRICNSSASVY
mgnify:CR=1 FL=1